MHPESVKVEKMPLPVGIRDEIEVVEIQAMG